MDVCAHHVSSASSSHSAPYLQVLHLLFLITSEEEPSSSSSSGRIIKNNKEEFGETDHTAGGAWQSTTSNRERKWRKVKEWENGGGKKYKKSLRWPHANPGCRFWDYYFFADMFSYLFWFSFFPVLYRREEKKHSVQKKIKDTPSGSPEPEPGSVKKKNKLNN